MRRTLLLTAALSFVCVACHRPQPSAVVDAGAPAVDAGPPPPPELSLTLSIRDPDGGTETFPLTLDDPPTIPVVQQLELRTNEPLRNARLRILDEVDKVMASDEQLETTDAGIRDQVTFTQPLLGGHKYTVALDAQNPGDVLDPRGQVVSEKRLDFHTGGDRELPPTPPKKKKPVRHVKKHRRH